MEIFRGTVPTVTFELPTSDTSLNTVKWKGQAGEGLLSATVTSGVASVNLPYQQYDGEVIVYWNFTVPGSGTYENSDYHAVVTPILPDSEINFLLDDCDEEFSAEQRRAVERNVRLIIEAFCGQTFGKHIGTKQVIGRGDIALAMPERLLTINTLSGYSYAHQIAITADGWAIMGPTRGNWIPEIKKDDNGVNIATFPIAAPPTYGRGFSKGSPVVIDGIWGWHSVPEPVKEAARLLVVEYAGDPSYRDKYLTSMTAADWRIQFEKGAFTGTGNVRADQLLSNYVLRSGWAVV